MSEEKDYSYREFDIKKKNGKTRRICAPSKDLLKYQQSRIPMLVDIFNEEIEERGLEGIFHGFLPDRNCVTAATQHIGFQATLMMDIDNFFDTVKPEHIQLFDATSAKDTNFYHKDGTCAQGFATSPILANLAVIPFMEKLNEVLSHNFAENYALTIYADDIAISLNYTDKHMFKRLEDAVYTIALEHGFKINPRKTRVRFAKYGRRRLLGIAIGDNDITVPRATKRKLRAARHQENWASAGGLSTWSKCLLPKALRD